MKGGNYVIHNLSRKELHGDHRSIETLEELRERKRKKTHFLQDGVEIDQKLGEYLRSYTRFLIGHICIENGSG